MFKVNWRRFGAFIINFEHFFTPFSSVSIVNFEQVNAGWDITLTVIYASKIILGSL